jgi:hypothetical protein
MHRQLTNITKEHCQYPCAVYHADGSGHLVYTKMEGSYDVIVLARITKDGPEDRLVLSPPDAKALKATMAAKDGTLFIAYSSCKDGIWSVRLAVVEDMVVQSSYLVGEGDAEFYPALCFSGSSLTIAWTSQDKEGSRILARDLADGKLSEPRLVSVSPKAYRPSVATTPAGTVVVAYDRFNGSSYDIVLKTPDGAEMQVNEADGRWAANPVAVPTQDGIMVGWYDIGRGASFSFKSAHVTEGTDGLRLEQPVQLAGAMDWYQNISLASDGKTVGFAYTWGKNNVHVRISDDCKTWSEPVIMSLDDTNCAVHPHLAINKDSIDLVWQFALKNGHQQVRNAQIYHSSVPRSTFRSLANPDAELKQVAFTLPIPTPKAFPVPSDEAIQRWLEKTGQEGLRPYFGDIHGQSGISDGMGEIDQYFHFAQVGSNLDFTALTDHDCYPDWMSPGEWEWIRTTTRLHDKEGEFTTLLSYEWTPNEYRYDFGHKNVYYPGDEGELFKSGDEGGMTPDRLFASVKEYKAMAFPHHPAATWTMVSAATDWAFHDEEVQRQVEIFSRHAPFEFYGNRSIYTKNNPQLTDCSVQDALALGYHMGFTAGSDSHQLEHGIEGGILGMAIPALTRGNVFKTLYDRATWATTGARLFLDLKVDGKPMGSIVHKRPGETYTLSYGVAGTTAMTIELLRNNEVVLTEESKDGELYGTLEATKTEENCCYYLRVRQQDEHQGWSSPVWVEQGLSESKP